MKLNSYTVIIIDFSIFVNDNLFLLESSLTEDACFHGPHRRRNIVAQPFYFQNLGYKRINICYAN